MWDGTGGASEATAYRGKYIGYFGDESRAFNAEIGPKGPFEI